MRKITNKSKFKRWHLEMIRAIVSFALSVANVTITDSIPGWRSIIDRLKTKLDAIDVLLAQRSLSIKGYAQTKKQLKATLVETTVRIMNAVYNYALSISDADLAGAMLITESKLLGMSYENITKTAQAAIDIVTPLVASLTDYDVTAPNVTAWQTQTTNLNTVLASVKNKYASRKTINKNIQDLGRECLIILYQEGDTFITSFKADEPDYYNDYFNNRKLNPHTEHTKFKVRAFNELEQPVFGVKIQQDGTENAMFTDVNGEATLHVDVHHQTDQQPVYSFSISSGETTISSGNIEIKLGHTVTRTYTVAPTGFIIPQPVESPENVNA